MFGVIILLVMVSAAAAQVDEQLRYTCPPANVEQHIFRMLSDNVTADPIPTMDQVMKDLSAAPPEIQKSLENVGQNMESVAIGVSEHIINPFISRCCPSPSFTCNSVRVPLFHLSYLGGMCYILFPFKKYHYTRCTCSECLVPGMCPIVGRCVETSWQLVSVVVYCPRERFPFVKLLIRIPTQCNCVQRCPLLWPPFVMNASLATIAAPSKTTCTHNQLSPSRWSGARHQQLGK